LIDADEARDRALLREQLVERKTCGEINMPIEQIAPELSRIVSPDAEVTELGRGFGNILNFKGPHGFELAEGSTEGPEPPEGPVWYREGGYLLFSDIGKNRRMKWSDKEGVTLFKEPTNHANGMTRDKQGRLIACEHKTRRVTREEADGAITVVATEYRGRKLNRPNDVIVKSDGCIYFTDPGFPKRGLDLDFNGVYQVTPDLGTITLISWDFTRPNGLAFSPDEKILYINDTRRNHIRAFNVDLAEGMPLLATDRVFCDMNSDKRVGLPDGMKVDVEGNVYCGGPGGIWIIDPSGKRLGTIVHGAPFTTNMAWGGDDWKTLFFTTIYSLCCIRLDIPGIPVP
jgi:gluconolactonase